MSALRQAKTALISYAANEQWQLYKAPPAKQPGALPCPDNDDSGTSSGVVCSGAALTRIGRLPYLTIGSDDLRDASGERLWYAVSSNFYRNSGVTVINSDTQGLLTVTGTAPASNVVAVVIAPGAPVLAQNRIGGGHNDPLAYLESFTNPIVGSDAVFDTRAFPTDNFNDRLLVITQAELMAAVEPVVAARIERDIKPYVQAYFNDWGAYPFAAAFAPVGPPSTDPGRAQTEYKGVTGQTNGLLPLTTDLNWAGWQTFPSSMISITQIPGGTGNGNNLPPGPPPSIIKSIDCSASTASQISCRVDYSGSPTPSDDRPAIKLQATLQKAAASFPIGFKYGDASMTDINGDPLPTFPAFGYWSPVSPVFPPTTSNTAFANGTGLVVFTGRLQNGSAPPVGTGGIVTIKVPVSFNPITSSADPKSGWFVANQWYRQTYFAVSPGYVPGGGNSCGTPPPALPCLTVNKLPPSYATSNDKRAILVFAGRALKGTSRPSGTPADYFENANLSAALGTIPYVYEHRAGGPTSINDRVVVVAP
jgi:hypothetical protein